MAVMAGLSGTASTSGQLSVKCGLGYADCIGHTNPTAFLWWAVKIEPGVKAVRDPAQAKDLDPGSLGLNVTRKN
jgi:hypothetical protein